MVDDYEEITIEVPWGHIAGKWWGPKDVQPILAIHGWQDNAGTFDTLSPLLKGPKLSILCIDLPGHGLSSHYPQGQYYYLFWDGVICVRRIAKYFKWDKISILGHSLGGAIGFLYSAIYPDEVNKYISLDIPAPIVRDYSPKLGDIIDRFLKYETLKPSESPTWNFEEMLGIVEDAYKNNLTRESCEILMRRGMKRLETNSALYSFTRDMRLKAAGIGLFTKEEIHRYAISIKCKVLNIKADSGLFSKNSEYYDEVIDKIRTNASVVEYHQVTGPHHVHLNNPERVSGKWWGPRHIQPILAIHGWQDNAGAFDPLVPLIIETVTSIFCIDLPGHGHSSHLPKGLNCYIYWEAVFAVRRVVKHFNWDNITILGHSLGGSIAFLYAAVYPLNIKNYISLDVASPTPKEPSEIIPNLGVLIDRILSYEYEGVNSYNFQGLLDNMLSVYQGSLTENSAKILLKRGAKEIVKNEEYTYARDVRLQVVDLGFFTLEEILALAKRITCDVLYIRSTESTIMHPTEIYNTILDAVSIHANKCENYTVEGTHHVLMNNPERVAGIINNFLKKFWTNNFCNQITLVTPSDMYSKWEEISIPVPWGHVSGKWWGSKDVQPIVALHGQEDNAGTFDTLAPLLIDEDISILSIDLPGHGFSSHFPKGVAYYQIWDGVICLRRIAKHFNWNEINIMGHSLGAAIGFLYAATYPNEVHKFIALDAVAPVPKRRPSSYFIDRLISCELKQSPILSYVELLEILEDVHKNNLTQKSCEILMKRGIKQISNGKYSYTRDVRLQYGHLVDFPVEHVYQLALNIKCQVLNIRADPGERKMARKGSASEEDKEKKKERGRDKKKKSESGSSSTDSSRSSSESSSSSGSKSSSSSSSGSSSRSSSSSSDSSSSSSDNRTRPKRRSTSKPTGRKSRDGDKKEKERDKEKDKDGVKDKDQANRKTSPAKDDKAPGTKPRSRSRSRSSRRKRRRRSPTPRPTKIHIGRLTRTVTKEHIIEIFSTYGIIKHVEFPKDHIHQHIGRGYAYVEFATADEAENAMKHMDGGQIDGQEITAAPVLIPKPRPPPIRRSPMPMRRPPMRRTPPRFRRRSPLRPPRRSPIRRRPHSRSPPPRRRKRSRSSSSSSR
ncbi:hypothetical protein FQR65_LT15444 [Abscondita terminalis]|nr:hypothetical protein FQR65_LT15444 [Abscondita terminalis]